MVEGELAEKGIHGTNELQEQEKEGITEK